MTSTLFLIARWQWCDRKNIALTSKWTLSNRARTQRFFLQPPFSSRKRSRTPSLGLLLHYWKLHRRNAAQLLVGRLPFLTNRSFAEHLLEWRRIPTKKY